MFNWKFSCNVYFPWLHSVYKKIHRELNNLIDGKNDKTWNEKITSWMNQPEQIDWKMILFLVLLIITIGTIILQWYNALPSNPGNSIVHEDNENEQTYMEYSQFIPKPLEINRIIKARRILNFLEMENYSQFYIVSLGINGTGNSSLQINEIFDTTDSPDDDKIQRMIEFKSILDEIIDRIESQSKKKSQRNMPPPLEDSNLEWRSSKIGSKIPLLRSRQR
ncbi:uncharacterized protein LOC107044883 [Diachasma alloeum]|uniref:uncharacterized protein LOC107044883 n=1 Tax=Diachasma alloeum TaxID=454923 RepID=UPI0007383172|nr:uncharacterized protein LOC107044883 [Diachasma alloeum]